MARPKPTWSHDCSAITIGSLLVLSFAACGPSPTSLSGGGWEHGGGDRPVLSWPVVDSAGNLVFLAGEGAVPSEASDGYEVDAVVLVSLDAGGATRWITEISGPRTTGREVAVRPVVGPDDDVWVHFGDELTRCSHAGEISWRLNPLPLPWPAWWQWTSARAALASDGTYYALPNIAVDTELQLEETQFHAIGPDGVKRWEARPGLPGGTRAEADRSPTWTEAPLVMPDGRILVGCDTCNTWGLAAADPSTGALTIMSGLPVSTPAFYQSLIWDGSSVRLYLRGAVPSNTSGPWVVGLDGAASPVTEDVTLVAATGAIWIDREEVERESFVLHWGTDAVDIVVAPDYVDAYGFFPMPVAAVEPEAILVAYDTEETNEAGEFLRGLLLVDRSGDVLWHRDDMFGRYEPIPVVGDGFIAYIEAGTQRLVAVEAPVERVADGPWPIIGGDPQGTRSAQGR